MPWSASARSTIVRKNDWVSVSKLAFDVAEQCASVRLQVGLEGRVMFFDEVIEESAFRTMAFIARRNNARAGFPVSRQ